jgi:predicted phosphoribosyltransferase
MLLTSSIYLPHETTVLAEINQAGDVTYNDMLSAGELEDVKSEYFSYIEQQKLEKKFNMNRLLGSGGLIDDELLKNRNIILVSDGLSSGLSLEAAMDFLKPIRTKRIIMAVPFASVSAVDRMHILADEIHCLNVLEDIISIDHYYDTQDVPSHDQVIKTIEEIILNWR